MTNVRAVLQPLLATLLIATMAGCSSGPSAPVSTPTPSSVAPTESAMERQQREDFEAAEKAYRTFIAEKNRVARSGGARRATAVMRRTAAGPYLTFYVGVLSSQKDQRLLLSGGTAIKSVERGDYATNRVTLKVCEDGSGIVVRDRTGKKLRNGIAVRRDLYVFESDGLWKVRDGDDRGRVDSCDE